MVDGDLIYKPLRCGAQSRHLTASTHLSSSLYRQNSNVYDLHLLGSCTDMEDGTWPERGSRDTRGTTTTRVMNMGEYSLRDDSIDSYLAPFNRFTSFYHHTIQSRYRTYISTTASYPNITFHHRNDSTNKASCKANLLPEHSFEYPNTASRSNLHDHRTSLIASGHSQTKIGNV